MMDERTSAEWGFWLFWLVLGVCLGLLAAA